MPEHKAFIQNTKNERKRKYYRLPQLQLQNLAFEMAQCVGYIYFEVGVK